MGRLSPGAWGKLGEGRCSQKLWERGRDAGNGAAQGCGAAGMAGITSTGVYSCPGELLRAGQDL